MAKKNSVAEPVETISQIDAPYELPEGWKWQIACDIANVYTGNSINEKVKSEKYEGQTEGLNFIGTKDIDFDGSINYANGVKINDFENFKTAPANTPLLCIEGGSSGKKLGFTNEQVCFGNKLCAFVCKEVEPKLIYYYLQTNFFYHSFMKERHGLIGGVSVGSIKQIPFPLPQNLTEQKRIVNHIESMFAKLDEAKEKAQNVVDSFETRKAAILHQAFTGNLTAKWRKENGVKSDEIKTMLSKLFLIRDKMIEKKEIQRPKIKENFDTNFVNNFFSEWKVVKLGSIAFVTKLAGFEYTKYIKLEETGDIPAIRAQNVRKGYLDESNLLYISKETSEFLQRSALTKKSVLVTFIGAGIGDVCVFDKDRRYHLAPNVAKVEPFNSDKDEYIDVNYILYYLLSHFGQHEIFKDMKATAQPSLSMETIRDITIPIPTIGEQKEIVRILNIVLEKERIAKSAAEQVLEQIDLLKKSILARAFRGEL